MVPKRLRLRAEQIAITLKPPIPTTDPLPLIVADASEIVRAAVMHPFFPAVLGEKNAGE